MVECKIFTSFLKPDNYQREEIVDFLYKNLEEYGDEKQDIDKAVAYALKERASMGGFVLEAKKANETVGVVVVNRTGMEGYIPENILVYIATHKRCRGQGIGKHLMQKTIKLSKGDIALHVEPENPARNLYEKLGFENKYFEMRYKK
ncbi:GNAT family N-acetyltransferase [Marinifilum sp. RC60d5]|uniref:GNAT family N-acetyltransferase n=1 Tax=Marinifilum sp. RC60d5 TaxID=3458414 RepID=UPI0040367658